jgi:hemerythrin superfamily protein
MDAIDVLKKDHREIGQLFSDFEQAMEPDEQHDVFIWIADALTVHTKLEEAHFYPAVRVVNHEEVHQSLADHLQMKELIAQLLDMDWRDPRFPTQVSALKSLVQGHVEHEERELFPEVRRDCDPELLEAIAERMIATRDEIEAEAEPAESVPIDDEHAPV